MISASLVCDGRRLVGTVAQDPATDLWLARCMPLHAGVLAPLLEQDCGRHQTKVAAVEAVLRANGVFSVWDM